MATTQGPAPSPRPSTLTPAIIILGADALLAARPASPAQLVNACYAAGYSAVIPSSWGDELVAARCLREIASRGQGSVVLCACPRVAEQMRRVHSLLPQMLPLVSPPVAAARYLRARAGRHGVNITYVGDCPGGTDPAIDRHATPGALLRSLSKRGIEVATQPTEVEERLLRDARRFYSLPGGAPAPNWLYVEKRGYTLVEPNARDFLAEVAFRVSKRERRVVDLAPRLGCTCSGAVVGQPWTEARDKVASLEPPRAVHEVLDHDVPVDLSAPLEPWAGSATDGEPTVPIALEALAAMYDADARASTIRAVPPAPVPRRRRTSGAKAAEPTTPTGVNAPPPKSVVLPPARAEAVPAIDSQPGGGGGDIGAASAATDVGPASLVAAQAAEADAGFASEEPDRPPGEPMSPTPSSRGDRPGRSGPRLGEGVTNPDTEWIEWQPRSSRVFQWLVVAACVLLAAAATTLVGMLLLGHGGSTPITSVAPSPATSTPQDSSVSDTSAPAADTAAQSPSGVTPTGAPTQSRDSTTGDTTAVQMPAMHDLPRLPIRPTSAGGAARGSRALASVAGPGRAQSLGRNPAPVYAPGAAPIPRAAAAASSSPSGERAPTRSPADTATGSPLSATEAAAIRAEIARRRHRVDSLRQLLDSLSKKTAADSP